MLQSTIIFIISIGIGLLEVPNMLKNKLRREVVFYLLVLSMGTICCILLTIDIELPNPIDWLNKLLKPLGDWLYNYLQ